MKTIKTILGSLHSLHRAVGVVLGGWLLPGCFAPLCGLAQAPPNDACAGAIALTEGVTYPANTTLATSFGDAALGCRGDASNGVWFIYRPTFSGLAVVS